MVWQSFHGQLRSRTHAHTQKNKNLISTKATVTSSLLGQTPLLSFTIMVDERAFLLPHRHHSSLWMFKSKPAVCDACNRSVSVRSCEVCDKYWSPSRLCEKKKKKLETTRLKANNNRFCKIETRRTSLQDWSDYGRIVKNMMALPASWIVQPEL